MATIAGLQSPQQQSQVQDLPMAGESSWIANLHYDPNTLQLTMTTKKGAQYTHFYVFPMQFQQMLESPSKGEYYSKLIKGKHPSARLVDKNVGRREFKTHAVGRH